MQAFAVTTLSAPANCMPDACFCEAVRDEVVRQPANTLSGFAFVGVAVLVLSHPLRHEAHALLDLSRQRLTTLLFGVNAIVLGAGTIFYHASLTFFGQTLDVFGMYLVVTLVIALSIAKATSLPNHTLVAIYAASNVVLLASLIWFSHARRHLFAALVIAAIIIEVATRGGAIKLGGRDFRIAVLLLGVGFLLWALDLLRIACAPESWIQGHALWHLCGAAALWFVFKHTSLEHSCDI